MDRRAFLVLSSSAVVLLGCYGTENGELVLGTDTTAAASSETAKAVKEFAQACARTLTSSEAARSLLASPAAYFASQRVSRTIVEANAALVDVLVQIASPDMHTALVICDSAYVWQFGQKLGLVGAHQAQSLAALPGKINSDGSLSAADVYQAVMSALSSAKVALSVPAAVVIAIAVATQLIAGLEYPKAGLAELGSLSTAAAT